MNRIIKKRSNKADLIFYIILLAIPVIHCCVFYIGANFNSILLAFKSYDNKDFGNASYTFCGMENFIKVINDLLYDDKYSTAFINSFLIFLIRIIPSFLVMFFAYYIVRKRFASGFFKIMLFLPSIISPLILTLMFRYFVDGAIPNFFVRVLGYTNVESPLFQGLFTQAGSGIIALIVFMFLCSNSNVILYMGAISSVNGSVLEAAEIDGANEFIMFFKVVFPLMFKSFIALFIANMATLFTYDLALYGFFSDMVPDIKMGVIGYWLTVEVLKENATTYPYLSAFGLIMTLIVCPITLITRRMLMKIDPMED